MVCSISGLNFSRRFLIHLNVFHCIAKISKLADFYKLGMDAFTS